MDDFNAAKDATQNQPEKSVAHSGGVGSIIGAIIIIILLAVGAFYFWGARLNEADNNPPPLILGNDPKSAESSSDAEAGFPPQGDSDAAESIEAEIQGMDLNQFDAQIDKSLQEFGQGAQ